ncbi:hypothetical protein T11_7180, partial [Trichinella zimbabwensis]
MPFFARIPVPHAQQGRANKVPHFYIKAKMPFFARFPVPCAPRRRANKLLHFYKE